MSSAPTVAAADMPTVWLVAGHVAALGQDAVLVADPAASMLSPMDWLAWHLLLPSVLAALDPETVEPEADLPWSTTADELAAALAAIRNRAA